MNNIGVSRFGTPGHVCLRGDSDIEGVQLKGLKLFLPSPTMVFLAELHYKTVVPLKALTTVFLTVHRSKKT